MKVGISFVPADLLVGAFLAPVRNFMGTTTVHVKEQVKLNEFRLVPRSVPAVESRHELHIYLVPMFPIKVSWTTWKIIPQDALRARLTQLGIDNEKMPLARQDLVHNVMDAIRKNSGLLDQK